MPGPIERLLNFLLLGLVPPTPYELRADYVEKDEAERKEMRRKHAMQVVRWCWVVTGVAITMIIKWLWEYGFLSFLGLTAGYAQAGDLDKAVRQQQADVVEMKRAQQQQAEQIDEFKRLYQRNTIEDRIRAIDTESFNLRTEVTQAQRENRSPDRFHLSRMSDLATERESLLRRLQNLETQ